MLLFKRISIVISDIIIITVHKESNVNITNYRFTIIQTNDHRPNLPPCADN